MLWTKNHKIHFDCSGGLVWGGLVWELGGALRMGMTCNQRREQLVSCDVRRQCRIKRLGTSEHTDPQCRCVPPSLGRSRRQHQLLLGGRGRCSGGQRGRLRLCRHRCSANGAQERPRHGQSVAWSWSESFRSCLPFDKLHIHLTPNQNENRTTNQ